MNLDQKNAVLKVCEELEKINFVEIAIEKEVSQIGNYSIADFDSKLRRVLLQLKNELNTSNYEVMSNHYSTTLPNQVLHTELLNDLECLKVYYTNSNYQDSADNLQRLIFYQITYGFWDKSAKKIHDVNTVDVIDLNNKIKTLEKQVKQNLVLLETEKNKVTDFITLKQQDVAQITQNTNVTNQNSQTINNLLTSSSKAEGQIEQIFKNIQEKQVDIEKLKTDTQTHLAELIEKEEYYKKMVDEYNVYLSEIESKKEYFDNRNKELDELIGKEASTSLFKTFKARKEELKSSVIGWAIGVPVAVIAVAFWVLFLFKDFNQIPVLERWIFLIINSIKTIPAIFLLVFAIRQYARERNFQEEYAFKSAVSLTILAYSDKLHETINKDKLIMDSVTNVYDSPVQKKVIKEAEKLNTDKIAEELKKALEKYLPDILKK
jgi:hypothetical protein